MQVVSNSSAGSISEKIPEAVVCVIYVLFCALVYMAHWEPAASSDAPPRVFPSLLVTAGRVL